MIIKKDKKKHIKNSMDDNLNIMLMRSGVDLNLPVPFKIGDLLEIDSFPFDPKMHILIVGIGDNREYVLKVDPSKEEPYIALYHFGETEDAILKGLAESEYFNS